MAKKWYIIQAYSGHEKAVIETILEQARKNSLSDYFGEISIPVEERQEIRRGKKITVERKLMPGYILAYMDVNNSTMSLVTNTPRVNGFLGNGSKPMAISEAEAKRMIRDPNDCGKAKPQTHLTYEVGEQVRVGDGPFSGFNGLVEEVDSERFRVKVTVSIFGRSTPVELEFTQVEKV